VVVLDLFVVSFYPKNLHFHAGSAIIEVELFTGKKRAGKLEASNYMRDLIKKFNTFSVVYPLAFVVAVGLLGVGYTSPGDSMFKAEEIAGTEATVLPTMLNVSGVSANQVSVADMAVSVADVGGLSVYNQSLSNASSIRMKDQLWQVDDDSISKDITAATNPRTFSVYKAVEGDTVQTIADKHNNVISEQTIRWANGLKNSEVTPGTDLIIPQVDGVVYVIKDDDTINSIVEKYGSTPEQISYYNDDIIDGKLLPGLRIIVPGGVLPNEERPEYVAPVSSPVYSGGRNAYVASGGPMMAGNRYAYGYCTYYAYNRRVQLGLPVGSLWGNANTWHLYAAAAGLLVDTTPSPGAIFVQLVGYYGHVGIVESIDWASGTMVVSDMNGIAGYNRVGYATVPIAGFAHRYIH
jgi:surface antigen/LysM repeat protein